MRLSLSLRAHPRSPAPVVGGLLAGVAAYVFLVASNLGEPGLEESRDAFLYNGLLVGGALLCLARALRVRNDRVPWLLIGLGLVAWAIGDIYYYAALSNLDEVPFPSLADAFYLAFYPFVYAGLALLLRSRLRDVRSDLWLDGLIAALTAAAVGAALVFGVIVEETGGAPLTVWTNLAYPVFDLGLIGVVILVLAMTGWHVDRMWACVLTGAFVFGVSDAVYLYQTAAGTYVEGTIVDAGWLAGCALIAAAAWQPTRRVAPIRVEGFWVIALPTASGVAALALLVYDHFRALNTLALVLVSCALAAVIGRMALTFCRNSALLEASRREAETDALTGLANRRKLLADLEARLAAGIPTLLLLFDLDGFKSYNDAFGHPAGDSLLRRLADRLSEATRPCGTAYRMGGDEFCVIATAEPEDSAEIIASALSALSDDTEGFPITSAYGAAVLPDEASELTDALRIADARLYGNKGRRRAAAGQARDVLLSMLHERDASLAGHISAVACLARAVGERLGLTDAELEDLTLAAELHDVGKLAIPDSILAKPAALAEDEWPSVRRHTVLGERIVASAPALSRVGRVVRATHERMDGRGYPDGLVGEQIPLLARIVSVCDAFIAMTEERPYRRAMTAAEAERELRLCAGSHFDPAVVDALVAARPSDPVRLVA
ncbi:MAG: diguanylate cyclase [Actinomycetota bacterium]|nr:diguanylate cyclase [Actinomycetota bacterium]